MTTPAKLEPHDLSKLFPPISEEDFGKLAGDIKLNGLHQPIMRYQGKILDGNNRYRACELVKIAPKFADFTGDDAAARNYVISANIHRRHLSPDQRREIIVTLLRADPTQSNRQVADTAKVDHKTVGVVRAGLEAGGEIPHQEKLSARMAWLNPPRRNVVGKAARPRAREARPSLFKKWLMAKPPVMQGDDDWGHTCGRCRKTLAQVLAMPVRKVRQ